MSDEKDNVIPIGGKDKKLLNMLEYVNDIGLTINLALNDKMINKKEFIFFLMERLEKAKQVLSEDENEELEFAINKIKEKDKK